MSYSEILADNSAESLPAGKWRVPRLRFTLGSFLAVVGVICVWLGYKTGEARRQEAAVSEILSWSSRAASGIMYDWQLGAGDTFHSTREMPLPDWLCGWAGENLFFDVRGVWAMGKEVTDSDIEVLRDLPKLRLVSLRYTAITDETLKMLGQSQDPGVLSLDNTEITNAGLRHLIAMDQVHHLHLSDNPQIDDQALKYLAQLKHVEYLALVRTSITYDGYCQLRDTLPRSCRIEW